jgi:hypothetical protein
VVDLNHLNAGFNPICHQLALLGAHYIFHNISQTDCQLKEETLDRTMWRNRFGRGFGAVVWQITDDDDDHTATCRPLFKRSVSLLKLTWQSSCGSNFDRTSTVFIWLSLVILINLGCKGFSYAVYLSVCLHRCLVAYLINYSLAHSLEARHSFDWLAV